jgi:hypothetical protein
MLETKEGDAMRSLTASESKEKPVIVWFQGMDYAVPASEITATYAIEEVWVVPEIAPFRCGWCQHYRHGRFVTLKKRQEDFTTLPKRVRLCNECATRLGYGR